MGGVYNPANLGLYTYSWNSPVRLRDANGEIPIVPIIVAGGLILLVGSSLPADRPNAYQERTPTTIYEICAGAVLGTSTVTRAVGRVLEPVARPVINALGRAGNAIRGFFGGGRAVASEARAVEAAPTVSAPSETPAPLPLPQGPNGELAPSSDYPHTQIGWQEGRRGGYIQTRDFGPNGQPLRQVDWTNHGRPAEHTNPHVHDYVPNPTGGSPQHGPGRPPNPGET